MEKREGNRIIIKAVPLLLLLFMLLLFFAVRPTHHPVGAEIESIRTRIAATGRIVHAGGFLTTAEGQRVAYTNSFDALDNMYKQGNRVCEIDIRQAGDGELVCAHGDDRFLADGCALSVSASGKDFLSTRVFNEFQPMTVQMLAQFMRDHDDLLVITDIAHDNNIEICERIALGYPDLHNRFIIQIYHEAEYEPIAELGFPYIIYTLYRANDKERNYWRISHFAETHALVGVTTQKEQFYIRKNQVAMPHCGIPLMFHTVNNLNEINQILAKSYVLGVYTDLTM